MVEIFKADENFDFSFFLGSSCAFGVFDGLHKGHRYLLDAAVGSARHSGGKSIALTFDIDPDEVFHPQRLKKLMTNEDRVGALAKSGVDAVVVLPFTKEFSAQSPHDFLTHTFNGYPPAHLHIGADFKFGVRASGTVKELDEWGAISGTEIHATDLRSEAGEPISSTRIRLLLAEGEIEKANDLLGYRYFIRSIVEQGRGEGVDLGFRTANMRIDDQLSVLGEGVYAAYSRVDGICYKSAVSVGISPVFKDVATATCEAHLIDFSGDLYGRSILVEFVGYLRPMIKFDSKEELIETVLGNIEWVRNNL